MQDQNNFPITVILPFINEFHLQNVHLPWNSWKEAENPR